jgi:hypothetical protein
MLQNRENKERYAIFTGRIEEPTVPHRGGLPFTDSIWSMPGPTLILEGQGVSTT